MPAVQRLNEATRANYISMISHFAASGMSDPDISQTLRGGLTPDEVAALRRENGIEAGEQRWRGQAGRAPRRSNPS